MCVDSSSKFLLVEACHFLFVVKDPKSIISIWAKINVTAMVWGHK